MVITLVSHPSGLRFEHGFKHHTYPGLKGLENGFHNSLNSMLDEYVDVWMGYLVFTLASHTKGLRFQSGFTYHNCLGLNRHN